MSTSLLYHAFGIRGYRYVSTRYEAGAVIFTIDQPREAYRCAECGSSQVHAKGSVLRRWRGVPIGGKPVWIEFPIPRVFCWTCRMERQVAVSFAEPKKHYCRSFERYVLELLQFGTLADVARHLQISWDTVKDIQRRNLQRRFGRPRLKHLKQIAIDEISIGKGHRYVTVVLDLASGAIVFVGQGKGAAALEPFWRRLRGSGAKIRAVATDLSPAYIQAVLRNLPRATLVFDRFHLVKLFNAKLSELRRELYREATDQLQKQVLKGTRWLLLKNPEHLDPKRDERQRLEEALALNHSLSVAYYLKEDLRRFWEQPGKQQARGFLKDWCARARASGIRILQQFANTLQGHRTGLLAWYDYPISTGPLEGTNNKIKTLQRQSYGFRDQQFFILKLYGLHQSKHALVG
jgi:transposase